MLRTEPSCNHAGGILLKLSKLIPRTSVASIVLIIKLDNHRVVGIQWDLVLHRVWQLEKSRVGIYRRNEVAGPSPASAFTVLLHTISDLLLLYSLLSIIQTQAVLSGPSHRSLRSFGLG